MSCHRSFVVASLLLVSACSSPAPPPPPSGGGKQVDQATAGAVTGRVTFDGQVPAAETIRMNTDQKCVQGAGPNPQSDAVLVAADGSLKNVFVYVKDGLDSAYSFAVPTEAAVLDQKGCIYTPRVLGVRAGQALEIVNSDPTVHNVHAVPMSNQEFNKGQPFQGMRERQVFTVPEVMVRFMCNVHGWMAAHVGVVAHPFFAVTDASGKFELKGLPPGTYTLEAWHEKFGRQTERVTIGEKQTQTVAFTFKTPGL
ncbi:MAG TPA: carboxypeptidase regulatory-like domain-containing protein [Vicinamibacterales bacterium]|nr:carboxypeptidase regulatory-like domain-containing protein [Vicinamibacterales bacterium]